PPSAISRPNVRGGPPAGPLLTCLGNRTGCRLGPRGARPPGRKEAVAEFADQVTLRVQAGDGGDRRPPGRPGVGQPPGGCGGPEGGNGGRGGDVILEVDPGMATLLDLHRRPVRRAGNGKQGSGSNRNGADGADLVVRVPDGTVVATGDGEVLADLVGAGTRFV